MNIYIFQTALRPSCKARDKDGYAAAAAEEVEEIYRCRLAHGLRAESLA